MQQTGSSTRSLNMGRPQTTWFMRRKGRGIEEASILSFLAGADILLFGADTGHEPAEQDGNDHLFAPQGLVDFDMCQSVLLPGDAAEILDNFSKGEIE